MSTEQPTLREMAHYLRAHGIPAEAGTTGGNCNQVIVYLTEGDEVLVGDTTGPLPSVDEAPDEWWVGLYLLDQDPMDMLPDPLPTGPTVCLHVLTLLVRHWDGMFDFSRLAHLNAMAGA